MTTGVKPGSMRGYYAVGPTEKQRKAIDGYLKGRKWTEALRVAGYSKLSALHYSKKEFFNSRGAQKFVTQIDRKAAQRFGESLPDKVMEGYLDGLEATKSVKLGQRLVENPDWVTRKQFLDRFSEFFGWIQARKRSYNAAT